VHPAESQEIRLGRAGTGADEQFDVLRGRGANVPHFIGDIGRGNGKPAGSKANLRQCPLWHANAPATDIRLLLHKRYETAWRARGGV